MSRTTPQRISAATLRSWLSTPEPPFIVDVRDDDRVGGHIRGSLNVPSCRFMSRIEELRDRTAENPRVVFHCQLSQQRGPNCARAYAAQSPSSQQVYILDQGFAGWASDYGTDLDVTEAFVPELYT